MSDMTRKPNDPERKKYRVSVGQVWAWDDTPEWEFGQMWLPICARCGSGPLVPTDEELDSRGNAALLLCEHCDDDYHLHMIARRKTEN